MQKVQTQKMETRKKIINFLTLSKGFLFYLSYILTIRLFYKCLINLGISSQIGIIRKQKKTPTNTTSSTLKVVSTKPKSKPRKRPVKPHPITQSSDISSENDLPQETSVKRATSTSNKSSITETINKKHLNLQSNQNRHNSPICSSSSSLPSLSDYDSENEFEGQSSKMQTQKTTQKPAQTQGIVQNQIQNLSVNDQNENLIILNAENYQQQVAKKWAVPDPFSQGKFVFKIARFPFKQLVGTDLERWLTSQESVLNLNLSWTIFTRNTNRLLQKYKKEIISIFPNGLSSTQTRHFCGVIEFNFPLLAEKYDNFRNMRWEFLQNREISIRQIKGTKNTTFSSADFSVRIIYIFGFFICNM